MAKYIVLLIFVLTGCMPNPKVVAALEILNGNEKGILIVEKDKEIWDFPNGKVSMVSTVVDNPDGTVSFEMIVVCDDTTLRPGVASADISREWYETHYRIISAELKSDGWIYYSTVVEPYRNYAVCPGLGIPKK